jgi:hypothetical protein
MQHRVQVGLRFYSVTVIQEAEREWLAFAEVTGKLVVSEGKSEEEAVRLWQNQATAAGAAPKTE